MPDPPSSSSSDDDATIDLGDANGLGAPGRITLRGSLGRRMVEIDGETGYVRLKGLAGRVRVGGPDEDGELILVDAHGEATLSLNATADMDVGGHGHYGSVHLNGEDGKKRLALYGNRGEIVLYSAPRTESIRLNGEVGNAHFGGRGQDGDIFVHDKEGETTIHLNGDEGVIRLPNADCAEDFAVSAGVDLAAGEVVVLGSDGRIERSSRAYDTRVAGVVSGAGDTRPGIVLGRGGRRRDRLPVALIGRVECRVDAGFGTIEVGDLLATSPRPGHAMKAADRDRAFGALLGKAMRPLADGAGVIPVLVTLG